MKYVKKICFKRVGSDQNVIGKHSLYVHNRVCW